MNIGNALADIEAMGALLRINDVLTADGEDGSITKGVEDLAEKLKEIHGKAPETDAERLAMYKKDIGDEMFTTLASNPNLQEMANKHCLERGEQVFDEVLDGMMKLFEETAVTRDDLRKAFGYMIRNEDRFDIP